MTYLKGIQVFDEKHRLFSRLYTFLIINACIAKAFTVIGGRRSHWDLSRPDWGPDAVAGITSALFPGVDIVVPLVGPIESILADKPASELRINIKTDVHPQRPTERILDHPLALHDDILGPTFVEFYENNVDWLKANVSSDYYKWPAPWDFARVVRNAVSHGGVLSIDNPKAQSVSWYGLSYGPAQNKRKIIGTDLSTADTLILMLEMSDTLDRLGCPA